ncbi:hypothetical protein BDV93DRAFT_535139 [Ceratobasidium sp. AG-I]|nr:hypothetical protein BDV93DRAFT_535139 [Ceratobasidium sp. AG-I]
MSQQLRDMTRSRIDGLLAYFPKLVPANFQHTSIEVQGVRYMYQLLGDFYILLITNKGSNIFQDIDTLHLFAHVVSDACRSADEREITRNALELLGAFDEVVSLGYREQVGLTQVRSILELESHEEKIQEIIAKAKGGLKGRANWSGGGGNTYLNPGMGSSYSSIPRFDPAERCAVSPRPSTTIPPFKASCMKLGKKAKQSDLLDTLGGEIAIPDGSMPGTPLPTDLSSSTTLPAQSTQTYPAAHEETVHLLLILRDGRPKEFEITGDLDLKVSDPADARVRLVMAPIGAGGEGAQFKQHPNVAKFVATAGLSAEVKLKDSAGAFPIGQPLGVLKWRWGSKDESGIPLSINCWPSPAGDVTCEVNIEWELEKKELELQDVVISIPLPSGAYPTVSSHTGSWAINPNTHSLDWTAETVSADTETTGSLEFSVGGDDAEAFFPVKVNFKSEKSLIGVEVLSAERVGGEGSVVFSKEMRVGVEQYLIV